MIIMITIMMIIIIIIGACVNHLPATSILLIAFGIEKPS
jgi:hypothetical protein